MAEENSKKVKLSAFQRAKIDKNRQKALLLRESRIAGKLELLDSSENGRRTFTIQQEKIGGTSTKIVDTGAGFFLDDEETAPKRSKRVEESSSIIAGDSICVDCGNKFLDSYLLKMFDHPVCDKCKDLEEKHKLITKTDAKAKFVLSDTDLKVREPILKFINKKNPHNPRWGDMSLYLLNQVEKKALEIHGSMKSIENKLDERASKNAESKKKKFAKKMKQLQREVRSSLYQKDNSLHEHEFDEEECVNEEDDIWKKTCSSCGYCVEFEKM